MIACCINLLRKFTTTLHKTQNYLNLQQAIFLATPGFFLRSYICFQIWNLQMIWHYLFNCFNQVKLIKDHWSQKDSKWVLVRKLMMSSEKALERFGNKSCFIKHLAEKLWKVIPSYPSFAKKVKLNLCIGEAEVEFKYWICASQITHTT